MFKRLLKAGLERAGFSVIDKRKHYSEDGLSTIHDQSFRDTPAFRDAYARGVEAGNGVDPQFEWRVHTALWAARTALNVAGSFVECGVNAGFMSSAIMHHLDWNAVGRRFYLIDTFAGPPLNQFSADEHARRTIAEDTLRKGGYVTDLARVRANFAEWPNAVVIPGVVPNVLATLPIDAVAFLHIDMNCALPERAALEYFWPRLSHGALVLLDDYAYSGHAAQKTAIDALGIPVLSLPTGQGLIVK